jgi:hypothetical protein
VNVEMSWQQRILSLIAHPQIAYLLLTLGTLGLTIELWSPGAVLPGVAGGICLLLAFFAFQILPVSYAGVLLILFGLGLLVLEVKVTSYGLLGVGGRVVAAPWFDDAHRLAAAGAADRVAADYPRDPQYRRHFALPCHAGRQRAKGPACDRRVGDAS